MRLWSSALRTRGSCRRRIEKIGGGGSGTTERKAKMISHSLTTEKPNAASGLGGGKVWRSRVILLGMQCLPSELPLTCLEW